MKIVTTLLLSALCVFAFAPAMPQIKDTITYEIPKKSDHISLIQERDSIANRIRLTNSNILQALKKIEYAKRKKHLDNNIGIDNGITFRTNARN